MDKRAEVLKRLKSGEHLTKIQAMTYIGLINLGDAIHILRHRGHDIKTTFIHSSSGTKYASYSLEK